jgi:hypothetical protein
MNKNNNSEISFVKAVLNQSSSDVNTKDASVTVSKIAEQLTYLHSRDLFNMPETRAKYFTKQIEFFEDTLSNYITLLNYVLALKTTIEEKDRCISSLYHTTQINDIDKYILTEYLQMNLEAPAKQFTLSQIGKNKVA